MSRAELNTRIIPLMSRKTPLSEIIETMPEVLEAHVIAAFDELMCEAFDIELAYTSA